MKSLAFAAVLAASLLPALAAAQPSAACIYQRTQVEIQRAQRVQLCRTQTPTTPGCQQAQDTERLHWQLMDRICFPQHPLCAAPRQLYDFSAQQRRIVCEAYGSYQHPSCNAAQLQEDVDFLRLQTSCFRF